MEYIQELLKLQQTLAEAFEDETQAEILSVRQMGSLQLRRRGAENNPLPDAGRAVREAGAEEGEEARFAEEEARGAPEERLRARLQALRAANGRTGLLSQTLGEQAAALVQERQGVFLSEQGQGRFSGGVLSQSARHLNASGVAGQETHRSMQDISRYFERDARRYGG